MREEADGLETEVGVYSKHGDCRIGKEEENGLVSMKVEDKRDGSGLLKDLRTNIDQMAEALSAHSTKY